MSSTVTMSRGDALAEVLADRAAGIRRKAVARWRGLVETVLDKGELSAKQVTELEDAAADIGLRPEEIADKFADDVDALRNHRANAAAVAEFDAAKHAAEVSRLVALEEKLTADLAATKRKIVEAKYHHQHIGACRAAVDNAYVTSPRLFAVEGGAE